MRQCLSQGFWLSCVILSGMSCAKKEDENPATLPQFFAETSVQTVESSGSPAVPYLGLFTTAFPEGLPMSFGSGLSIRSVNGQTGEVILYGLTDRGPNGDAPELLNPKAGYVGSKVFPLPRFQPSLFRMSYQQDEGLKILSRVGITDGAVAVTGLPLPTGVTSSLGELPLSESLLALDTDAKGLDPEGIDFDQTGMAWICDEYGPFLMQVNPATGAILQKLSPGQGLPKILDQRQPNRGFEGVAVADNGKVYAMIQSNLDVNGKTKKIADFIRLFEYDPKTKLSRMFAYPIERAQYGKLSDAKIGDLLALGNDRFAVIEQGNTPDKTLRTMVYGFSLGGATDLSDRKIAQGPNAAKDLEFASLEQLLPEGIQPLQKFAISDLRLSGWTQDKAEGLAKIDDSTLMVIGDNDFGLKSEVQGGSSSDPQDYQVDANGVLSLKGEATLGRYQLSPMAAEKAGTQLMILKLAKPLKEWFAR